MSKHRIVDGRLLQMNKRYGQLNTLQDVQIVPIFNIVERTLYATMLHRATGTVIVQQVCFAVFTKKFLITCLH